MESATQQLLPPCVYMCAHTACGCACTWARYEYAALRLPPQARGLLSQSPLTAPRLPPSPFPTRPCVLQTIAEREALEAEEAAAMEAAAQAAVLRKQETRQILVEVIAAEAAAEQAAAAAAGPKVRGHMCACVWGDGGA